MTHEGIREKLVDLFIAHFREHGRGPQKILLGPDAYDMYQGSLDGAYVAPSASETATYIERAEGLPPMGIEVVA